VPYHPDSTVKSSAEVNATSRSGNGGNYGFYYGGPAYYGGYGYSSGWRSLDNANNHGVSPNYP
jgi:hypothetical protein